METSNIGDTPIARQLKPGDRFFRGKVVFLISENNEKLGTVTFEEACEKASAAGLDLVEMAGKADPPVCRIMDFGKYQYQEDKRARDAKKNQVQQKIKEIKFHLHIDDNDFNVKIRHALEFLEKGDKVRFIVAYRGREMTHQELGEALISRVVEALGENAIVDSPAKMLGKNCQMVFAPNTKLKKKTAEQPTEDAKNARK